MDRSAPELANKLGPNDPAGATSPALLRTMGLFSLVVYGVGDMVGSGIYATVGIAAGRLGNAVWLAFVVSMVAALFTGMSYACLASRYPRAAGAAYVTHRAYGFSFLSYLVGLTVTASGLTSMATQTNAFAEYLRSMTGLSWYVIALTFLAVMTAINFWGIRQSMWTNLLCTAVEVGGLIFIIAVGARFWGSVNYLETPPAVDAQGVAVPTSLGPSLLLSGAVLTFFSFIGFEDMLNVAEEVKEPRRTMPWGIILALAVATVLYIGVAVTAVSVVNYEDFAKPGAPLSKIANRAAPWLPARTFDFITLFAVANTMLINYIMGSRLLYGMARHGLLPSIIGRIHPARRTPHVAIFTLLVVVLILAMSGGKNAIDSLASATALLLLTAFIVVNTALVVLKLRPGEPTGAFEVPVFVPLVGVLINATLIVARLTNPSADPHAPRIVGAIVLAVTILYFTMRPTNVTEEALASVE
ncbi:MAG TPA: APC family permease [Lacipirellulaceae bacterium]|nr:APC family permease [Lacipirellulaceae bacterium]